MIKNTIYWKDREVNQTFDFAIIGCGIVGLCSAILLKQKAPRKSVVILEKGDECGGASIRNAGFVCFGSPTEILDDLSNNSEEEVVSTIKRRFEGIKLLSKIVDFDAIDYHHCRGQEVFFERDKLAFEKVISTLDQLNNLFYRATGKKEAFGSAIQSNQEVRSIGAIDLRYEGVLDPYKLYRYLVVKAKSLGVTILFNTEFSFDNRQSTKDLPKAHLHLICTNAYTHRLVSTLDVKPVRNQVYVTNPIHSIDLPHAYHYDKGYIYFRKVDDRILIGGARNHLGSSEMSDELGNTQEAKVLLFDFLKQHFSIKEEIKFDYRWSGILGVGDNKQAIVREVKPNVLVGVRLGGMGIAIGASVADQLSDLALIKIVNH